MVAHDKNKTNRRKVLSLLAILMLSMTIIPAVLAYNTTNYYTFRHQGYDWYDFVEGRGKLLDQSLQSNKAYWTHILIFDHSNIMWIGFGIMCETNVLGQHSFHLYKEWKDYGVSEQSQAVSGSISSDTFYKLKIAYIGYYPGQGWKWQLYKNDVVVDTVWFAGHSFTAGNDVYSQFESNMGTLPSKPVGTVVAHWKELKYGLYGSIHDWNGIKDQQIPFTNVDIYPISAIEYNIKYK